MDVRVSVVIPLFNKEAYVAGALDSVLRQTFVGFEIVVVDDGSTDGSAQVVARCHDPRVRLVRQSNLGVSGARNRGVAESTGRWVAFLDADDEWMPSFLERTIAVTESFPNVVAVFTNYLNEITGRPMLRRVPKRATVLKDYFSFARSNGGLGMFSSAVVVRRDVLQAIGGFPVGVPMGEDLDTWARLAWSGPVAFVPEPLAIYHAEALGSVTRRWTRPIPYPEVVRSYRAWRNKGSIPAALQSSSELMATLELLGYVRSLLHFGQRQEARRALREECTWTPQAGMYFLLLYLRSVMPATVDATLANVWRSFKRLVLLLSGPGRRQGGNAPQ